MTSIIERFQELTRNKTKRVNHKFNAELWDLFEKLCADKNTNTTSMLEDLIFNELLKQEII